MPRPRFANLPEEKRDHILSVARTAFAADGFQKASYNRIIELCGLSKGVMYYYFDNKEDLYTTVILDAFSALFHVTDGAEVPDSIDAFWKVLRELSLSFLGQVMQDEVLAALIRDVMQMSQAAASDSVWSSLERQSRDWFGQYLAQGQALGAVRADLPELLLVSLTYQVIFAMDRWMLLVVEGSGEAVLPNVMDTSPDTMLSSYIDMAMSVLQRLLAPEVHIPSLG